MFDLFRRRDKFIRYSMGALLVIVALSMLLYLIPGSGMGPGGAGDQQVLAEVGGDQITAREVVARFQNISRQNHIPEDLAPIYMQQLIDNMITDRAMVYQANKLGIDISDADLARVLRNIPQIANLTPEQYRQTVQEFGQTVPQFESDVRANQYMVTLQDVALAGVIATPEAIKETYIRANEKAKIDYIAFTADKFRAGINPTPAEIQSYYARNQAQYTIPESKDVQLIVIDRDKLAASLQVPDAQVRAYYDAHTQDFRTPERVKVRHILLQTTGKSDAEKAKLKAQAEDLLKQIKNGGNFAELAKKYSQDPGSAPNGGELGWVARGQTVKGFENAAFSLAPGQTSGVISTEYGFHILQVEDKQPAQLQPFDKVKDQIADSLKKQQMNDKVTALADQVRAALAQAPTTAQQVAAKYNVDFVNVADYKPGAALPGIGVNQDLDSTISGLQKGQVSPVAPVSPSKLAVAVVTNVTPAHVQPLSAVEAQVRDRVIDQKAIQVAGEKAKAAAATLKSNGGDLQAIAKNFGLQVKSSDLFTRNGAVQGLGAGAQFQAAFTEPVGSIIGPYATSGGTVVAKVVQKVEPDMTQLAAQKSALAQDIKERRADQMLQLFRDSVLSHLIKDGKVKIHRDAINNLLTRYRS